MSSPVGGGDPVAYLLQPNVPVHLYAAEDDPTGCTIVNASQSATAYIGANAALQPGNPGAQQLGPQLSISRRPGEVWAVSAAACLIQVIPGASNPLPIGTPTRPTDIETLTFASGAAWVAGTQYQMTSQTNTQASAQCKLFLVRAASGQPSASGTWTLSVFYPSLGYTATLATLTVSGSAQQQAITPTDVDLLSGVPYELQLSPSTSGSNVIPTPLLFTATLVPE